MNRGQFSRREYLKLMGATAAAATTVSASDFSIMSMPVLQKADEAEHERRMKWWRDARFGMFIH